MNPVVIIIGAVAFYLWWKSSANITPQQAASQMAQQSTQSTRVIATIIHGQTTTTSPLQPSPSTSSPTDGTEQSSDPTEAIITGSPIITPSTAEKAVTVGVPTIDASLSSLGIGSQSPTNSETLGEYIDQQEAKQQAAELAHNYAPGGSSNPEYQFVTSQNVGQTFGG